MKDKITNWCRTIFLIVGAIGTFAVAVNLPSYVTAGCVLVASVAVAIVAHYTGKGPDGKPLPPI